MKSDQVDEVVEMEKDDKGTYKPVAVYRKPVTLPRPTKVPAFYQVVDGFMYGLDALERFFNVMKKYQRGGR